MDGDCAMKTADASGPDFAAFTEELPMSIDQQALELLQDAYRAAYQRGAAVCVRILPALGSRDHGAGDGLPQVFRVLGHAARSWARFAAANPRPMVLLLVAIASLYFL